MTTKIPSDSLHHESLCRLRETPSWGVYWGLSSVWAPDQTSPSSHPRSGALRTEGTDGTLNVERPRDASSKLHPFLGADKRNESGIVSVFRSSTDEKM